MASMADPESCPALRELLTKIVSAEQADAIMRELAELSEDSTARHQLCKLVHAVPLDILDSVFRGGHP